MFWNNERLAALKQQLTFRIPYSRIAASLGTTRNAVIGKVDRDGLRPDSPLKRKRLPPGVLDAALKTGIVTDNSLSARASPGAVAVLTLQKAQCRYPIGDPLHDSDFHFCTDRATKNSSYCKQHSKLCIRKMGAVNPDGRQS